MLAQQFLLCHMLQLKLKSAFWQTMTKSLMWLLLKLVEQSTMKKQISIFKVCVNSSLKKGKKMFLLCMLTFCHMLKLLEKQKLNQCKILFKNSMPWELTLMLLFAEPEKTKFWTLKQSQGLQGVASLKMKNVLLKFQILQQFMKFLVCFKKKVLMI